LVVAPWNNLLYNLSAENLAKHGLHPRFLHFLVNLPLLAAPLLLALALAPSTVPRTPRSLALALAVLVPTAALSIAPHQEYRFLLPTLVPLVLLAHDALLGPRAVPHLARLWLLFNAVLIVLFGFLHQGGLVPAMVALQPQVRQDTSSSVIFYHTYSPPRYLLLLSRSWPDRVVDLQGGSLTSLESALGNVSSAWLVTPTSSERHLRALPFIAEGLSAAVEHRWLHLSFETPPTSWSELGLSIYKWSHIPTQ